MFVGQLKERTPEACEPELVTYSNVVTVEVCVPDLRRRLDGCTGCSYVGRCAVESGLRQIVELAEETQNQRTIPRLPGWVSSFAGMRSF